MIMIVSFTEIFCRYKYNLLSRNHRFGVYSDFKIYSTKKSSLFVPERIL